MLASICSRLGGNSHAARPQILQCCSPQPFSAAKIHSVPPAALSCCRSRLSPVTLLSSPPQILEKSPLPGVSQLTYSLRAHPHARWLYLHEKFQAAASGHHKPLCLPGVEQAPHLWISAGSTAPCQGRGCCYLSSFSHYPEGWVLKPECLLQNEAYANPTQDSDG